MSIELGILLAVFLPLIGSPVLLGLGRGPAPGRRIAALALAFPVISFLAIASLTVQNGFQGQSTVEWPWVPSLGLNLSFLIDGLSLFFGLVVSGMGILVFFYARHYFDDQFEHPGRFYFYLTMFMAAMLGTLFSNHLILLFIFWELTGVASFLLIGFLHSDAASRRGARMALLITSVTALALLAGLILLGNLGGSFHWNELLTSRLDTAQSGLASAALLLVVLGAFGKSAQFPFHFWLPNAMAAPTPVSAYLHSATMVKLGVFLTARMFPMFSDQQLWINLVGLIPFITMTLGALLALLSHDLKAMLAFSTVSQLGYLIGYYGLGPRGGVDYDYLHILNHVFYKGSLFMVVGIIAHATGTRDLRQLGGLWRRMPWLGVACLLGTATMAGVPGTTGFLSKELILKEIFEIHDEHGFVSVFAFVCVLVTSLVKVAFSARIFLGTFFGRESETVAKHFHAPPRALLVPPLVLASGALVFGLFAWPLERLFDYLKVPGLQTMTVLHLPLWHGFTKELLTSFALVVSGLAVYAWGRKTNWSWGRIPRWLRLDEAFDRALNGFASATKNVTAATGADRPELYLQIIMAFVLIISGGHLLLNLDKMDLTPVLAQLGRAESWDPLRLGAAVLIVAATLGAIWLRRWTAQLISLSAAGFLTTLFYLLYRAPDLALTQILVETITLLLVLLLLSRFPKSTEQGEMTDRQRPGHRLLPMVIAIGMGLLTTGMVLLVTAAPHDNPNGQFYLDTTVTLAKGSNAVNTILVDYRALDTLGEIAVLVIATLASLGLYLRYKRTPQEWRQGPMGLPGFSSFEKKDHHD